MARPATAATPAADAAPAIPAPVAAAEPTPIEAPVVAPDALAPVVTPTLPVTPVTAVAPGASAPSAPAGALILAFIDHEIDSAPDQNGVTRKIKVQTLGLVPLAK